MSMGIYIKGMKMPTNCDMCWALDDYGDYPRCRITEEQRGYSFPIREKRMDKCPLVPVPEHGDLIDRDELLKECDKMQKSMDDHGRAFSFSFMRRGDVCTTWYNVEIMIEDMPTIIPAEEKMDA